MIILDANYILRFLLKDDKEMYMISKKVILGNECFITLEVLAEVIYVLLGVYKVDRAIIGEILTNFVSSKNIKLNDKNLTICSLKIFSKKRMDFVDSILCCMSKDNRVATFDKRLNNCIKDIK